jgi:hypothetical protein
VRLVSPPPKDVSSCLLRVASAVFVHIQTTTIGSFPQEQQSELTNIQQQRPKAIPCHTQSPSPAPGPPGPVTVTVSEFRQKAKTVTVSYSCRQGPSRMRRLNQWYWKTPGARASAACQIRSPYRNRDGPAVTAVTVIERRAPGLGAGLGAGRHSGPGLGADGRGVPAAAALSIASRRQAIHVALHTHTHTHTLKSPASNSSCKSPASTVTNSASVTESFGSDG